MLTHSVLSETALRSELAESSIINPRGGKFTRNMAADLLLTALVDAFSILVIFLLMSFSSTGDLLDIGKTELPKAALNEVLQRNPVVKIQESQIFLENEAIAGGDGLLNALLEMRKKYAADRPGEEFPGTVTVQADRRVKYDFLNQVILACANAGFSDIHFAVLAK